MSQDYRIHPIFGKLTDPEEIMIFDRQQEEEEYKRRESAYYERMCSQQEEEYYRQMEEDYYHSIWMHELEEQEYELEAV